MLPPLAQICTFHLVVMSQLLNVLNRDRLFGHVTEYEVRLYPFPLQTKARCWWL